MLLQSYQGFVEIFPAIPAGWSSVSFNQLRTEGAFLVSAKKQDGSVKMVTITSEKEGTLILKNPFGAHAKYKVTLMGAVQKNSEEEGMLRFDCKKGATITMRFP